MENKYRVISFDLSKSSTGVSIIDVEDLDIKIIEMFSIKQYKANNFNKLYHYSVSLLMKEIEKIFLEQKKFFTVAFEYNTFGDYTSELGFYLVQEFLKLCHRYHINAVGYSVFFLKKFVKKFVVDKKIKYPGRLQKNHIREIYTKFVYPLNKCILPNPDDIKDSDSMDALFLGILGVIFQGSFLKEGVWNGSGIEPYLIQDINYYRDQYLEVIKDFKFNNFVFNDKGLNFGKQFKDLLKDADKNKHLSLESKLFFPYWDFNIYTLEAKLLKDLNEEKFYEYWKKKLKTNKAWLKKYFSKNNDFVCLFNKQGKVFLHPKVCD